MTRKNLETAPVEVLLIATSLSRTSSGGMTFLEGLIRALATQQDQIRLTVVTPRDHEATVKRWFPEVRTIAVMALAGVWRVARDLLFAWCWVRRIDAAIVIQPHEWAPLTSRPCMTISQNIGPFHPDAARDAGLGGRLIRWLAIHTAPRVAVMVAVSSVAEQLMDEQVPRLRRITIIPEVLLPPSREVRSNEDSCNNSLKYDYCLVVGRAKYKNSHLLERALTRAEAKDGLPRIVVVGGDELDVAVPIEQRGHVERDELLALFRRSRVAVIPSSVESFGLPALEALSMGALPVVLSGTAMAEWLSESAAVLSPDTAESALASMFSMTSSEVAAWVERNERADTSLERFSPMAVGAQYLSAIQSIGQ